ncbi:hypothetical protein CI610_01126 [invertebrate metagenome]|uniref:Ysc84 actin-binding domain-containing protein n=1 Tax=invertebrate metagenome TaxID=1711999 RepID=A0A2H9T9K2_9ZZZZ
MMMLNIRTLSMLLLSFLLLGGLSSAQASSAEELNASAKSTLDTLYKDKPSAKILGQKAKGILVFPTIVKAGMFLGGEYGEGALLVNGQPVDYYNIASASIGFQLGAQARSQVIMFMTNTALTNFRKSKGWEAGVDGSVAIASFGAGGDISTETAKAPIVGFVLDNKGLMYNLTLEGSKISKLKK